MELIHAALLLHSADKDVTEENVQGVLEGAGIDADASQVKAMIAALEDVDIDEAMDTTVATGAAPAAGAADGGAEAADEAAEEGDEEAEDEEAAAPEDDGADEEEAAEGLGSLF
jgi:large subunit ribosomal protein L12